MPAPVFVTDARLDFPSNRKTPIAAEIGFRMTGCDAKITAAFDWRETSGEIWTMTIETGKGAKIRLENGGGTLVVNGKVTIRTDDTEYPDIYRRFAKLLAAGQSDVDARPLWLVADAFLKGNRRQVEPFEW